jgi:hypothetical protein
MITIWKVRGGVPRTRNLILKQWRYYTGIFCVADERLASFITHHSSLGFDARHSEETHRSAE